MDSNACLYRREDDIFWIFLLLDFFSRAYGEEKKMARLKGSIRFFCIHCKQGRQRQITIGGWGEEERVFFYSETLALTTWRQMGHSSSPSRALELIPNPKLPKPLLPRDLSSGLEWHSGEEQ